jgi:ubiquitin-protein ligase
LDKQRILKEAQKIASRYSFWMVSGDISHLYGYVLESGNVKYEIEIKFPSGFPEKPPQIKYYDAVKDLLGNAELHTILNWKEDSEVVDIVSEIRQLIQDSLKSTPESPDELFLGEPPEDVSMPIELDKSNSESAPRTESSEEEYITPDLDAYPPEIEYETHPRQYKERDGTESPWEESPRLESKAIYSGPELLETDQSSLLINTEVALLQEAYVFDEVKGKLGKIQLYFTLTLAKNYLVDVDFSRYPKVPAITFPSDIVQMLGDPYHALDTLNDWKEDGSMHVVDVFHEIESKLAFITTVEHQLKKIQGEYKCDVIPEQPGHITIHLMTYGFREYALHLDVSNYPKLPTIDLSEALQDSLGIKPSELKSVKVWTGEGADVVEIVREIAWLVDKGSRINFEIELLKDHYKELQYDAASSALNLKVNGKMKSQDMTFDFQVLLPQDYPMKVPEVRVLNEFELESHEKLKGELQASLKGFFKDWTPFSYLVDLFDAISKKIFEVSVVSCVICHKLDCPTCSLKIAGAGHESCHASCPYCERPYHFHCWEQTIRSFGKCGFCLKTPPPDLMP